MREIINIIGNKSIIQEKVVHSEPVEGGRFTIISDPSVQQFNAMLLNARHHLLRLLCKDGRIYCWDGYYADHDIGAIVLGIEGGPADIGVRLEVTDEFIDYGEKIRSPTSKSSGV